MEPFEPWGDNHMPEQLSLPGLDARPASRPVDLHHLFFAILPDPDTAMRIERRAQHLRIEHDLKRRLLPTGHFHVTLHSIDTYPYFPQRIASTLEAVAATIRMPPFDITFDLARSFHRTDHDRPFVLLGSDGAAALKELHEALGTTLKKAGFKCGSTLNFTPHLTLLYDKREVDERAIEPVRWTAREFVLVDSLVGQTKHVQLARWPLLTRSSI